MNTYVYTLGKSAYINLTNACSNNCEFCIRNYKDGLLDYNLWLTKEPSVDEIKALLGDVTQYDEVVFCGYGEPTYRIDELSEIGRYVKSFGTKVRLNTNGHATWIHGDSAIDKLVGAVDILSISLNEATSEAYDKICHPIFEGAFDSMLDFTAKCAKTGAFSDIRMSVMDIIGSENIDKCKEIAERVGAKLFVRTMEK